MCQRTNNILTSRHQMFLGFIFSCFVRIFLHTRSYCSIDFGQRILPSHFPLSFLIFIEITSFAYAFYLYTELVLFRFTLLTSLCLRLPSETARKHMRTSCSSICADIIFPFFGLYSGYNYQWPINGGLAILLVFKL